MSAALDPRIGVLCCEGATVYYAYVNGYDKPETRGTLAEVEAALGLGAPVIAAPAPAKALPGLFSKKPNRRVRELREYVVTVTVSWFSGYSDEPDCKKLYDSYEFRSNEYSAKEAISRARKDYRDREGDRAVRDFRPTYVARRAD